MESLYLLYGTDEYLIEDTVKKIKKSFGELIQGINYILIDETNLKDLIFNIEVPAFGYDKKLIIARKTGLFKKNGRKKEPTEIQKEISTYINENIQTIKEMVVLVFVEDEIDKNAVFDAISKNGTISQIDELNAYQLVSKLKHICSLYKVSVDDKTINYLIETSGTNLQILMNEIRKLIEYAGENGKINKEDVDKLAVKQIESIIFDLTDNLGNRKIENAIDVLDNLIYQKEPTQKILVTLYNHFKKLYLYKIATRLNKDVTIALNLKPNQKFLVNKYNKQSSYFKEEDLKNILHEFVELDYKSKNGLIDLDVGLKSILCTI